ncbi:MAG: response regulator [Chloroflexota bacterium]|nr:response regulator [Chloroflexota bacterium]
MYEKVLVAEDEKDIRRLVVFTLQRAGFELIEAENGREALELAIEHNPAVILLDVMMPYMDGYEVCRKLRENPSTAHTPVLFLSAKGQHYEVSEGLGAGASGYIVKPFVPKELTVRVKQLLGISVD